MGHPDLRRRTSCRFGRTAPCGASAGPQCLRKWVPHSSNAPSDLDSPGFDRNLLRDGWASWSRSTCVVAVFVSGTLPNRRKQRLSTGWNRYNRDVPGRRRELDREARKEDRGVAQEHLRTPSRISARRVSSRLRNQALQVGSSSARSSHLSSNRTITSSSCVPQ
jgi:hypothetical protein